MPCNEYYYPWNSVASWIWLACLPGPSYTGFGGVLFSWLLTTKLLTQILQRIKSKILSITSGVQAPLAAQPTSLPTTSLLPALSRRISTGSLGICTVYITNVHEWGINLEFRQYVTIQNKEPWRDHTFVVGNVQLMKAVTIFGSLDFEVC